MVSSLTSSAKARLDRANWHAFGLGKLTKVADQTRVRKWCRENLAGDFYVTSIKETIGNRKSIIATFARVKENDDAMIFKLQWASFE